MKKIHDFFHSLDLSAIFSFLGIILLFSTAVIVTLIAPNLIDSTWTMPSSNYQVQMYEVSDPHFYISSAGTSGQNLQYVHHIKKGGPLLSFKESDQFKITAPKELEKYITKKEDKELKLTNRLLLLKKDKNEFTLYEPTGEEAFALAGSDGVLQDYAEENFKLIDGDKPAHGVIYINNPIEFKVSFFDDNGKRAWKYNAEGELITSLKELTAAPFAFKSRKELILEGEKIYAIEGCWYCHTDQTRTLVQDLVLNGSDSYPAPPSSPNEYIYQKVTFPGTKRNGPDLSRVGIKRQSRDWHKAHFWSPKTESKGSIMPAFRHFFDFDPRGTSPLKPGVPNEKFEAIFQYLMTKGTRITPPSEAWWLGKDPIDTIEIIEGRKKLP